MNKHMSDLKILEKLNKIDAKVINNNKKINDIENKLDKLNENIKLIYEHLLKEKVKNDFKSLENKNDDSKLFRISE